MDDFIGRGTVKEGQYDGTLPEGCGPDEELVVLRKSDLERLLKIPGEELFSKHPNMAMDALVRALCQRKIEMPAKFYSSSECGAFPDEITYKEHGIDYRLFLQRWFLSANPKDMIFVRYASVDQADFEESLEPEEES
jgi:hypothetical protein